MSEGSVDLQRQVETLVTETDVRSQNRFGYGLPCHIAVFTIFQTDASAIQVGDAIGISTVSVGLQSGAVRKIEHAQRLPHHLINDVVVAAVEAGSIKAGKTFIFGSGKHFAVIHTAQ